MTRLLNVKIPPQMIKTPIFDAEVQQFLCGRLWQFDDLPFLQDILRYHITQKFIAIMPGIQQGHKPFCRRCHNTKKQQFHHFTCERCKGSCLYCLQCLQLGRISCCTMLAKWCLAPPVSRHHPKMSWQGQLTAQQQQVSIDVLSSMMKGRNHLVHAVTGAGKTEILFPVIAQALIENWRICIATPRTDVVIELVPRIQQAFTTIEVQALYAGQKKSKKYAQIVIATTHQLYRFEEAFDLIIVDEVDAFPYSKDHYLQHAVNKSCSRVGRLLLLTATPTIQQIASFKKKAAYSFLSRRFHGVALPVPKIQPLWNYERKIRQNIIPKKLIIWIEKCLAIKAPFLLFFSSIDLMLAAEKRLSQQIPQIASVYADDPKRHEKVRKLRQKKYSGLLTTTILERGITIANLQVAVVGAEHAVFTTATLIQISGRVGRSKQFSIGEVVFFHHGITTKMTSCQRIIKKTNKMGYTV